MKGSMQRVFGSTTKAEL